MKIRSKVRAGGSNLQHNPRKLVVKSNVKAGRGQSGFNHNARIVVRSKIRAGGGQLQHNGRKLVVKSKVHAGRDGGLGPNHNARKLVVKSNGSTLVGGRAGLHRRSSI